MVCYFKAILGFEEISKLPFLTRSNLSSHDNSTGELNEKRVFESEGIKVVIKSDRYGYIEGSLHYYKNKGVHNYDDFLMDGVWRSIQKINAQYNIKVEFLHLVQLEFGLNFVPPILTNSVLQSLFLHHAKPFKNMYVRPGKHVICDHWDYSFKNYNKKAQYPLELKACQELTRTEVHAKRARVLNKLGVFNLADLQKPEIVFRLLNVLIFDVWENVLMVDPRITDLQTAFSRIDQKRVLKWSNPHYWYDLDDRTRSYQKATLNEFQIKNGLTVQSEIQSVLKSKAVELYGFPC
jgi:hypothetical protein